MMRKVFALWILLLICGIETIDAQQRKLTAYAVGFYNQENLFDTCHDEGKRDYDFLPEGSYKWNGMKYSHKLRNMAQALADNTYADACLSRITSKAYRLECNGRDMRQAK